MNRANFKEVDCTGNSVKPVLSFYGFLFRKHLMRWSKVFKRNGEKGISALDRVEKVVVFGGGSFGTAMGTAMARQRVDLQVTLLLRDPYICNDITINHVNTRYLKVAFLNGCSLFGLSSGCLK